VAFNRLDVLASLDGVEPGMSDLGYLQRAGVRVINAPAAAFAVHDKLRTARRLARAGIPQPLTVHVTAGAVEAPIPTPLVIKPRFGSWGRDVVLCRTPGEATAALEWAHHRRWFREQGAIVQAYVPHAADLRLVVAGGRLIGAVERRPAAGEWRTNFSLGGSRRPVVPSEDAVATALAAARAVTADLVGVDLIATPDGHAVLEINGSVDFDRLYSLPGRDAYHDAAAALDLPMARPCSEAVAITRRRRSQWSAATGWRAAAWT
jgi:[lysine-biosynthesis-protein LysW]--L-2-aminoadipate ligase